MYIYHHGLNLRFLSLIRLLLQDLQINLWSTNCKINALHGILSLAVLQMTWYKRNKCALSDSINGGCDHSTTKLIFSPTHCLLLKTISHMSASEVFPYIYSLDAENSAFNCCIKEEEKKKTLPHSGLHTQSTWTTSVVESYF